jgi:hypothetical protein
MNSNAWISWSRFTWPRFTWPPGALERLDRRVLAAISLKSATVFMNSFQVAMDNGLTYGASS